MRAAAAVWHATKSLVSQLSDNSTNYPGVRSRTNMGGPEEMLSLLFGKHCLVIIFKFIRPPSWFLSVTCPGTFQVVLLPHVSSYIVHNQNDFLWKITFHILSKKMDVYPERCLTADQDDIRQSGDWRLWLLTKKISARLWLLTIGGAHYNLSDEPDTADPRLLRFWKLPQNSTNHHSEPLTTNERWPFFSIILY